MWVVNNYRFGGIPATMETLCRVGQRHYVPSSMSLSPLPVTYLPATGSRVVLFYWKWPNSNEILFKCIQIYNFLHWFIKIICNVFKRLKLLLLKAKKYIKNLQNVFHTKFKRELWKYENAYFLFIEISHPKTKCW